VLNASFAYLRLVEREYTGDHLTLAVRFLRCALSKRVKYFESRGFLPSPPRAGLRRKLRRASGGERKASE
jgi:hypothetical protein